ncbi:MULTISPECIES: hypothetical protein [unclassified Acinetobacter]|uniref:hypothetical protein n=1 Tax=unclassified Acinetobacter TaxID=196816 RepID=UPI0035B8C083
MAYYHLVLEVKENLGKRDEIRDLLAFDIVDIKTAISETILPYIFKDDVNYQGDNINYDDIQLFEIKQTQLPIQELIQQKQQDLPSNTDVTITAFEVFNDKALCTDVTQVVFDILAE